MKTRIKICGITNAADARQAVACGADYIGIIVNIAGTPRSVSVASAARLRATCNVPVVVVADMEPEVLCDALAAIRPAGVQLVGRYTDAAVRTIVRCAPCAVWRTVYIAPAGTEHDLRGLRATIAASGRAGVEALVCDTGIAGKKGGTGVAADWRTARTVVDNSTLPVFLAGGITPDNAGDALEQVRPYGIDVSSGVEQRPGVKDHRKIERLIGIVRDHDARHAGGACRGSSALDNR